MKLVFVCLFRFYSYSSKHIKGCSLVSPHRSLSLLPTFSFFINWKLSYMYFCYVLIFAYLSLAFLAFYSSTKTLIVILSTLFYSTDFSLLFLLSLTYLSSYARYAFFLFSYQTRYSLKLLTLVLGGASYKEGSCTRSLSILTNFY